MAAEQLTYVQVSDRLMMGGSADARWVDDYYTTAYRHMPGYHKPEHYMELPHWIAIIAGMTRERYAQEVHIMTDVGESAARLADQPGTLLFSTIESNAAPTHELVSKLPHKRIIMGGHVNPQEFTRYPNVTFLDRPSALAGQLPGINVHAPPDNTLFAGESVIPRLTLSSGCLFACEFCMVPRQVTAQDETSVLRQVASFKPLDFDLVYLDDKSFGQAPNWRTLETVSAAIRDYNPGFKGYIVQTTANIAAGDARRQDGNLEAFKELGVQYTEVGVESVNPASFQAMVKPYQLKHLRAVTRQARQLDMPLIPNFIFGHPADNGRYDHFVAWVEENRDIIPAVNVNFLSVLFGATQLRRQRHLPVARSLTDLDQNAYRKSWLSEPETIAMLQAVRGVYYTTTGRDFYPESYARQLRAIPAERVVADALCRVSQAGQAAAPMLDFRAPRRPLWRERYIADAITGLRSPGR